MQIIARQDNLFVTFSVVWIGSFHLFSTRSSTGSWILSSRPMGSLKERIRANSLSGRSKIKAKFWIFGSKVLHIFASVLS